MFQNKDCSEALGAGRWALGNPMALALDAGRWEIRWHWPWTLGPGEIRWRWTLGKPDPCVNDAPSLVSTWSPESSAQNPKTRLQVLGAGRGEKSCCLAVLQSCGRTLTLCCPKTRLQTANEVSKTGRRSRTYDSERSEQDREAKPNV